ncbi:MAG: tRNA (adenosine(37)-N6)-dimethylallyltransferase MiaA [Candidatus Atribacteria bacterium]|nr:tRNA (adenosine(37)-N6)-dimethylallyltransferase MiaA [Candidatus Atribacteria bacterium]MCD6349743.1 tRNA (adenosine(37)-N6)-dimethylallyltransferase MiaA [Candidatus Atribacteria bacterium]
MVKALGKKPEQLPWICIVGPTASGKTELSLYIAERLDKTELIYADSMAAYKYLDVGTAKPAPEERTKVPHHLIDFLEPDERWSAFDFKRRASTLYKEIISRGKVPIVVGGTPFYLSVLKEMSLPYVAPNPRIRTILERMNSPQLFALLREIDPQRAQKIGKNDRKRLIRALEIFIITGKAPSSFLKRERERDTKNLVMVGIKLDKETIKKRIRKRIEKMFAQGLVEETRRVLNMGYSPEVPALNNFTYKPIVELLQGKISEKEAFEKVEKGTLSLLKRQLTWFRKEPILWLERDAAAAYLIDYLKNILSEVEDFEPR